MELKYQSTQKRGDIHLSPCAHNECWPLQAFNSSSFWGIPQVLGQHTRQKRFQQAGLGQHTKKVCTLPFAASTVCHTFLFGSTEHSAQGSEEATSMILKQMSCQTVLLESPQNPRIAGSADPLDRIILGTYPTEPTPYFGLLESEKMALKYAGCSSST